MFIGGREGLFPIRSGHQYTYLKRPARSETESGLCWPWDQLWRGFAHQRATQAAGHRVRLNARADGKLDRLGRKDGPPLGRGLGVRGDVAGNYPAPWS